MSQQEEIYIYTPLDLYVLQHSSGELTPKWQNDRSLMDRDCLSCRGFLSQPILFKLTSTRRDKGSSMPSPCMIQPGVTVACGRHASSFQAVVQCRSLYALSYLLATDHQASGGQSWNSHVPHTDQKEKGARQWR